MGALQCKSDPELHRQQQLLDGLLPLLESHRDIIAAVVVGSMASGNANRLSDLDLLLFTQRDFHNRTSQLLAQFEQQVEVIYRLQGQHNQNATFAKYILGNMTSIELHFIDKAEPFPLCDPFVILFDHANIAEQKYVTQAPPKHSEFPVYTQGDQGLVWELFDCIKWLQKGDEKLAKQYLKKLAENL